MKLGEAIRSGSLAAVEEVLAKDTSEVRHGIQLLQDDALLAIQTRLLRENPPAGALASALANAALPERVARLVRVVANSRGDEVRAVRGDHARLREAAARVVLLHSGVYAHDRDDDAQREVE